jgi:Uncharacterized protein conserved in bacteria (DUF2213)
MVETELDVARAIADGRLSSPTEFHNSKFYKVRISGTGVAWRPSVREFCYRPPRVWLTDEMCRRVAGLPVIAEHPAKKILDGDNFYSRIVGICTFGFVESDALFGIVRVIDKRAAEILDGGAFDTSPGVTFAPRQNITLQLDGDTLLIEDDPALLDHLALVDTSEGNRGVWTRDADPGVEITEMER